jgi:hypothetical protein
MQEGRERVDSQAPKSLVDTPLLKSKAMPVPLRCHTPPPTTTAANSTLPIQSNATHVGELHYLVDTPSRAEPGPRPWTARCECRSRIGAESAGSGMGREVGDG